MCKVQIKRKGRHRKFSAILTSTSLPPASVFPGKLLYLPHVQQTGGTAAKKGILDGIRKVFSQEMDLV